MLLPSPPESSSRNADWDAHIMQTGKQNRTCTAPFPAVPSNMAMARLGGPLWLSAICLAWGTVAACFAAIDRRACVSWLFCGLQAPA